MVSLPPPSIEPDSEPTLKAAGQLVGKAAAHVIAIPLKAAALLPKTAAYVSTLGRKTGATYVASGVARVAATTLNYACKAVRVGLEKVEEGDYIKRVAPHVNALAQEEISRFSQLRAMRGEQLQESAALGQRAVEGIGGAVAGAAASLAGAAGAAGIAPVAAGATAVAKVAGIAQSVASGVIEGVRAGERIERAASAKNSRFYQRYYSKVVDVGTRLVPHLLSGAKWLAAQGEQATGWAAQKAAAGMEHSAAIEEALYNAADRTDAAAFRLLNYFNAPESAQPLNRVKKAEERPQPKEIGAAEVAKFKALPPDEQEELLFLVQESLTWGCSKKEKAEFAEGIQMLRQPGGDIVEAEKRISKMLGIYAIMPESDKRLFTPSHFTGLDELSKLHFIQIVRDHAKGLNASERALLLRPEYRHLHNEGDWEKLEPAQKKAIEKLACIHFNRLPREIQEQLSSLTEAQFLQLKPEDRQKFVEVVNLRVQLHKSSSPAEKAAFAALFEKVAAIADPKEIKVILKAFNGLFTVREKVFLYSQFKEQYTYVKMGPKELEGLIQALRADYALYKPEQLATPEARETKAALEWLEAQQGNLALAMGTASVKTNQAAPAVPVQAMVASLKTSKGVVAPLIPIKAQKPIDVAHIQSEVGLHVGKGAQAIGYYGIGGLARIAGWGVGGAGRVAGNVLGYLSEPTIPGISRLKKVGAHIPLVSRLPEVISEQDSIKWIEPLMKLASLGVSLSAMLFSPSIRNWLQEKGVPLAEADQFLRDKIVFGLPNAAAFVAHGAADAGTYLLNRADEAVGGMLQLAQHTENAAKAPQIASAMFKQRFKAGEAAQAFAKEVVTACSTPDASALVVCSKEAFSYFSNTEKWDEFAQLAGVQKGSPAFYAALEQMARTGALPTPPSGAATGVVSSVAEMGSAIASTVYDAGAAVAAGTTKLAGKALGMVDSSFESIVGKAARDAMVETFQLGATGAAHLAKPLTNAVASGAQSAATTVSDGATAVQTAAGQAAQAVKEAVGLEQALPKDVKKAFNGVVEAQTKLLQLSTQKAICRKSALLLEDMNNSVLGSMALAISSNPKMAAALQSTYVDVVSPRLHDALSAFRGIVLLSESSKKYLEASMKAQENVEKNLEDFFIGYQKEALAALQQGKPSVQRGAAVGLGAVSTLATVGLGVMGATDILFPMLYGRILPHLLQQGAGPVGRGAQPFWYALAKEAFGAADSTGKKAQEFIASLTSYGQMLLGQVYIDQMRIDNFVTKLSPDEQNHLYDLVVSSKKLDPKEIAAFEVLRATPQERMTKEIRDQLAMTALKNFQKLAAYELLSISPTYYAKMDPRLQRRVYEVVEKYDRLTTQERASPQAIVEKFNKLTATQKAEIDDLTLSEYSELTADQQEDVRFLVAHSEGYKKLKKPAKMDATWQLGEFRAVKDLSNKELEALLPLYSKLSVEERALITPSRLRKMSLAKIQHLLQIVKTYHPEFIAEVSTASKGALNLDSLPGCYAHRIGEVGIRKQKERLLEALATVFNKLPAQQRGQAMLLTTGEYNSYSPDEKKQLLRYLATAPGLQGEQVKLKQQLVQLEKNEWIDVTYITAQFNRLKPAQQIECREMHELGAAEQASLNEGLEKELANITGHLATLTKASKNKKEVHFLAHTLEIKKLKEELQKPLPPAEKAAKEKSLKAKEAELQETLDAIQQYDAEIHKKQQEKQVLEVMLGKEPAPDELDVEPESMESRAINEAASAIATECIENELQGKYRVLDANLNDASKFEPLQQSFVLDFRSRLEVMIGKIEAAKALEENMKKTIRDPKTALEVQIRTREELRVLRTFWMPAYELQKAKYAEGLHNLKQEIAARREKLAAGSAPSLMMGPSTLRFQHRPQVPEGHE